MDLLSTRARAYATASHGAQLYGTQPYTAHLEAVASLVAAQLSVRALPSEDAEAALAAAWCHDVLEDCGVTAADLARATTPRVAALVDLLTNVPSAAGVDSWSPTVARIASDPLARLIKMADRLANARASNEGRRSADEAARAKSERTLDKYVRQWPLMAASFPSDEWPLLWGGLQTLLGGGRQQCVVWLSGNSGAGKTFVGDALERMAAFKHIDGDELFFSEDPADQALFARLVESFSFWFEGRPAPPELWHPYYTRQCGRVRAALAEGHTRVCVSLTVYHRETRDFLRAQLPNHTFLLLRCSQEELIRRARVRFAQYAASRGQSVEDCWLDAHKAPYSEEAFVRQTLDVMRGLQPIAEGERGCFEVDGTLGRPFEAIYQHLGLGEPPESLPVEEVAEVNYARFRAAAARTKAKAAAAQNP